jgi:hypothetical protein
MPVIANGNPTDQKKVDLSIAQCPEDPGDIELSQRVAADPPGQPGT